MSKLVECKACNKEIAKGAKLCPNCGKDQRSWFMRHKIMSFFGIIIILGVFGTAIGSSGDEEVKDTGNNDSTEESSNDKADDETDTEKADDTEEVPKEHESALNKAQTYSDTMDMSKAGVYDQLTSSAGEDFPEDAAQYAIDNVEADWKENALKKAEVYEDTMDMSESAVYDQLISSAGEKFTEEEAQYAIDNLN